MSSGMEYYTSFPVSYPVVGTLSIYISIVKIQMSNNQKYNSLSSRIGKAEKSGSCHVKRCIKKIATDLNLTEEDSIGPTAKQTRVDIPGGDKQSGSYVIGGDRCE